MHQWSVSLQRSKYLTPVYLNVYSFCHCCNVTCGWMGLGLYHTAIQIFGIQYMFHGWAGNMTGVSEVIPKTCPYRFQKQILLGNTQYTFAEIDHKIVQPLKKIYISNTYDLLNNNCNHFALAMAQKLNLQANHPRSYIFRITDCCNTLRCCIPNCILSGRLDWFTNRKKQQQQLSQIPNSEIKYRNQDVSVRSRGSENKYTSRSAQTSPIALRHSLEKAQDISQGFRQPLNATFNS